MIEQHGGKNSGSVSGKTDYILAGDNMGPAKLEKAAKLGVKIINETDFLKNDRMTISNYFIKKRSRNWIDQTADHKPVFKAFDQIQSILWYCTKWLTLNLFSTY